MELLDKVYWLRAFLGVMTGLFVSSAGFVRPNPVEINYFAIPVAIGVYLVSYYVIRAMAGPMTDKQRARKLITQGIGSYIMLFLFTWIVYNTLV